MTFGAGYLSPASALADEGPAVAPTLLPFISPVGKPYRSAPDEPYARAEWFASLDRDADGALTVADFLAEAEAFFAELDTDRDGRINGIEIAHYEQVVAPEIQTRYHPPGARGLGPPSAMPRPGGKGGGGPPGGAPPGGIGGPPGGGAPGGARPPNAAMLKRLTNMPQGAARFAILGMPQPVAAADKSFNGSVSPDEMREAAVERFGWLDQLGNGDGRLTWDELPQTPIEEMLSLTKADKKKGKKKDAEAPPPGKRQPID
ncbi:MAG: EF-hand domain-containing protein [Sphingopyxis sp.]|nr:EF-hand domain-containing protein [Sphingopyxis sp.]